MTCNTTHTKSSLVRILLFFLFQYFSYIIAQGVCYLILCEASFPKKMAFAYLEDLHTEFFDQYGRKVPTVTRPYSFIEFGKTVSDFLVFIKMVVHFFRTLCCFRHIYPEKQKGIHWQQSQTELGQHQHRAPGCSEDNGGKYWGSTATRRSTFQ